ncbi:hypothetical protein OG562_23815 [Streptomyces sp. NBC_01275]|uniref:hypothetical protein n=1 Tax=Streptomyces sp. NBC_01275 TaxID=2903807 RepID=UPI00225B98C8|nr:hypothetical protein [Streptomyces sp. NBC_01275]MCX4763931.1 hypothetical protein [Streptomyces sp. NBC_01275]
MSTSQTTIRVSERSRPGAPRRTGAAVPLLCPLAADLETLAVLLEGDPGTVIAGFDGWRCRLRICAVCRAPSTGATTVSRAAAGSP